MNCIIKKTPTKQIVYNLFRPHVRINDNRGWWQEQKRLNPFIKKLPNGC